MNLKELTVGMEFKNYKALCEHLGLEIKKSTNSKNSQLKEIARYFKFEKIGHKIKILDIYENVKDKINNYKGGTPKYENSIELTRPDLFELIIEIYYSNEGILTTMSKNNSIKYRCINCREEIVSNCYRMTELNGKCEKCKLSKNAQLIYEYLKSNNLNFELEYKFEDLKSENNHPLRFDFAIFKDKQLLTLIEYDGEFHSKKFNSYGTYDIQCKYDEMKDLYCLNANIQLLRINFKDNVIEKLHHELSKNIPNLHLTDEIMNIEKVNNLQSLRLSYMSKLKDIEEQLRMLGVSFDE